MLLLLRVVVVVVMVVVWGVWHEWWQVSIHVRRLRPSKVSA